MSVYVKTSWASCHKYLLYNVGRSLEVISNGKEMTPWFDCRLELVDVLRPSNLKPQFG